MDSDYLPNGRRIGIERDSTRGIVRELAYASPVEKQKLQTLSPASTESLALREELRLRAKQND
jgi:hypothetical protein